MIKQAATLAVAIATLAGASPLLAHHSLSMFDLSSPVWLKGTVVSFEPKQPHVMMTLESKNKDGQVQLLSIEGPNLNRFERMGADKDFLKPGEVVEVCGFPYKKDMAEQASSNSKAVLPYHGHMVVMPNGKMRLFGPYGKLENCVRENDAPQAWVDFLTADPLGQQAWCASGAYVKFLALAPKGFIDEVNRRMGNPCGGVRQ